MSDVLPADLQVPVQRQDLRRAATAGVAVPVPRGSPALVESAVRSSGSQQAMHSAAGARSVTAQHPPSQSLCLSTLHCASLMCSARATAACSTQLAKDAACSSACLSSCANNLGCSNNKCSELWPQRQASYSALYSPSDTAWKPDFASCIPQNHLACCLAVCRIGDPPPQCGSRAHLVSVMPCPTPLLPCAQAVSETLASHAVAAPSALKIAARSSAVSTRKSAPLRASRHQFAVAAAWSGAAPNNIMIVAIAPAQCARQHM
jgi:hypothetical protein